MERSEHNHSEDTTELLSAYLDNSLDITERRRAESFIQRCAACARTLQEMRLLKQWLGAMPEVQPRRSFRLHVATKPPRRLIFPTLRWATLAAAALLLVVLGVDTWEDVIPSQEQTASIQQTEPAAGAEAFGGGMESAAEDAALEADEPALRAVPEAGAPPATEEDAKEEAAPTEGEAAETTPTEAPMAAALEAPADEAQDETAQGPMADDTARGTEPSFDTVEPEVAAEAEPAEAPIDTLRIAVVVLLLATLALGASAVWAQFRHI